MDNSLQPITTKDYSSLHQWEHNPRNMDTAGFNRLKKQIIGLGRYKPLLTMADGTVLGGNMRHTVIDEVANSTPDAIHDYVLDAFNIDITTEQEQQILNRVRNPFVSLIGFSQQPDGTFRAVVNGEQELKPFKTQLDGMMEYALSDNDRAGQYDEEKLANIQPLFSEQIFYDYAVDFGQALSVPQQLAIGGKEDNNSNQGGKDGDKTVQCPNCSHQFSLEGHTV